VLGHIHRWPRWVVLLAPAALVALVVVWVGAASAASSSLEICKSDANGAAGVTFTFTATNIATGASQQVTVVGGTCAHPFDAAVGKWQITENLSSGLWNVASVAVQPAGALVNENDTAGWVKVKVSASAETQVTFTDTPAGATLKVCKFSASPALQGKQFSFTVGATTTLTATAGASKATAGCSAATPVQPGSLLKVTEAVPDGVKVAAVSVSPNATLTRVTGAVAKLTAGTGANIVYYDDEPVGPPQSGYVEVCKQAGDVFTTGTFAFTIGDSAGLKDTENVAVGQCTGPILVAAGNVDIAEAAVANSHVSNIVVSPSGRQGPTNLTNGTVTVTVPVSATPSGETQVTYINAADLATLKVCKVLTASSGDLAGTRFHFGVKTVLGNDPNGLNIIASTSASGACKNFGTSLPVGSSVTVTEDGVANVGVNGGAPGAGGSSTTTLGPGINTVTFTNQAFGTVEICKNMQTGDEAFNGATFTFTVGAGAPFDVAAGRCSPPVKVPAGTVTVAEAAKASFSFVSSTATGPQGGNRVVSGTNPVTVTVVSGTETLVTFTNKVQRARFKICKVIDPGSTTALGNQDFTFFYTYASDDGEAGSDLVTIPAGGCTGLFGGPDGFPVINTDGSPSLISVSEFQDFSTFQVTSIVVENGSFWPVIPNNPDLASGTAVVNPNVGVVRITYTNATLSAGG
jgi:hypothetical protein